jgi:glycosyltransferase involved in cell wall biosynthesis
MAPRAIERVLLTGDTVGGVWTYAIDLSAALARHGIEVTLFTTGGVPTAAQEAAAARLPNLTLVARPYACEWMEAPEADLATAAEELRDIAADLRPDIVHVSGFAHAAAGFAAPVVVVAHSCVPTWWRACHGVAAPAEWDGYRARLAAGLAAAAALVAPTHAFLAAFLAETGTHRNARVIHNGRDPGRFTAAPKQPVALAAGRAWDPAKNVAVLNEAARQMRHPVVVAGETGGADWPHLFPVGPLDAGPLAAKMAEAGIFVSPARYEPFGLAVLEAALSSCALVLAPLATFRELWEGAARFVSPDDPRALAAALEEILADPARARRAGDAARRRGERYTADRMADETLRLWRSLRAGSPAGRLNRPAERAA